MCRSTRDHYTTLPGCKGASCAFLLTFSTIVSFSCWWSSPKADSWDFLIRLNAQKLYIANKNPATPTHEPVTIAVIFAVTLQTPFWAV